MSTEVGKMHLEISFTLSIAWESSKRATTVFLERDLKSSGFLGYTRPMGVLVARRLQGLCGWWPLHLIIVRYTAIKVILVGLRGQ